MNLIDYQEFTLTTAIYPDAGKGTDNELNYLGLGLTSEAGEVAGKLKRNLREGTLDVGGLIYEIGDCAWYLSRLCDALGYSLEDALEINMAKLKKRKEANTITGEGDSR